MEMMGIGIDMLSILITFVILVGVLLGKRNAMNEYFPILLLMNALVLLADMGTLVFANDNETLELLRISVILQGSFTYISISGFNLYVDKLITRKRGKRPVFRAVPFAICVIMILFWISSLLHGYAFQISNDGVYSQGQLYFFVVLIGCILVIFIFFRILYNQINGVLDVNVCIALYIFIIIPFIVLFPALLCECLSMLYGAITVSYLIMFIAIHVTREQTIVEKKMDDTIMQTDLIISELQPHFIFNSLTNIKYLIKKNPELAVNAMDKFTKYLRRNLDTITDQELITFEEELEHTRTYLWLEQLRFGDLKIEYSIDEDQFLIPPLSLQPVVENAVRHGVTKKIGGGTIKIYVREMEDCYKITVKDDGIGFDSKQLDEEIEAAGIHDIRKRLYEMNKSKLSIASTEGVGTTVTYLIMKEDTEDDSVQG
ncbi:sensor histidine kinase [Pseudobutyrivibrio xylanivorans]|uniref:Histidine kinase-, DNA gyrase B-, and HSP90-like ATPase n=1 Tax=Pseudobutyrivibrio xylanivorans DSM 14809 TaxID=1123012 RepID=A0A1M6BAZ1_PSEXY|nr:histidine kinase [Pseudobutyrivibrio xylanivorans]SHI45866.1 Histidine kinase-, DNA gyrase B-, and HSP90-like ATPase [Pseudobutyrivibrio xylanivorans DSM 14809]